MNEAGLDKFDDPAAKIFQYATQKYSTENPNRFTEKLMHLEKQHQKAMDALMRASDEAGAFINSLGEDVLDASFAKNTSFVKKSPSQIMESKSEVLTLKNMVEKLENTPEELSQSNPQMKK